MKIYIGSDHGGYELKNKIVIILKQLNIDVIDMGTNNKESTDYPIYAKLVCNKVLEENALGILICTTGVGMSISANKVKGIRCARVLNKKDIEMAILHNNINVIALPNNIPKYKLKTMLKKFINTKFSNEGRHIRRIKMLEEL